MKQYLFAYGSLMNPKSRAKTLPGEHITRTAVLDGFQRKINAPYQGYMYLNIIRNEAKSVSGVLIELTDQEFDLLTAREAGYTRTDVTADMRDAVDGTVYAYIAPDLPCTLKVPRSYITTCTSGMPDDVRLSWINDTLMGGIEEDIEHPVYEFHA